MQNRNIIYEVFYIVCKVNLVTFLILLLQTKLIFSQNFVPNPSFEDTITCPQQIGYPCPNTNQGSFDAVYFWSNPICTSSDIFHQCSPNNISIPNNSFGHQYARSGNAMAGVFSGCTMVNGSNYSEYITSSLTNPLSAGELYTVSFYVVCATPSLTCNGTNGIGAFLSIGFPDTTGSKQAYRLNLTAQVNNPISNIISDTINWILIADTLTANGGENYITIGNFLPDSSFIGGAYFYIDDIKVEPGNHLDILENTEINKFSVYPNPCHDILFVKNFDKCRAKIFIFDITGRVQFEFELSDEIKIDISNIPIGIYSYYIVTSDGKFIQNKFVKF